MLEEFEKASWDVDKEYQTDTNCENVVEWIRNSKTATISFSQGRYISKIKRLAERFPDKVQIVAENPDGSIVAHIPVSAVHISIRTKNITEEQRQAARERFINLWKKRRESLTEDELEEIDELEDQLDDFDDPNNEKNDNQ